MTLVGGVAPARSNFSTKTLCVEFRCEIVQNSSF